MHGGGRRTTLGRNTGGRQLIAEPLYGAKNSQMFDLGKFVYHYTSAETAAKFILPTMALRLGSFERVNDPREAKTWPFKFYARNRDQIFDADLFSQTSDSLRRKSLVLCCSGDDLSGSDEFLRMGFAHPRMWAQYAENHRGVCLVLDREEIDLAVRSAAGGRRVFTGPVEYLDSSSGPSVAGADPYGIVYLEDIVRDGLPGLLEKHIERFHKQLFFTKHHDWQHEKEHRWVVRSDDDAPMFLSISRAIRAVLLGADCPSAQEAEILACCRPSGVAVHRVYWHGWAVSVFGNLLDPLPAESISLNGLYFSQRIPCSVIYFQVCDQHGFIRTVSIDTDGHVKLVG